MRARTEQVAGPHHQCGKTPSPLEVKRPCALHVTLLVYTAITAKARLSESEQNQRTFSSDICGPKEAQDISGRDAHHGLHQAKRSETVMPSQAADALTH